MVIAGCTDHYELGEYGKYSGDVRELPVRSFSAVLHGADADTVPVDHQHPPDDGSVENVTPDAPANTGHVTPEVWSAGNAGKQSFGDQTHTAATSTGAGMSSGGLLNAAVRSSMPSLSLGNNLQDTVSAAGRNDIGTTRQSTRMTSQGLSEAWSSAFQGSILKTLP